MVYRKVSMIEVKEILTRVARGQTKRKIRRDLSVHGLTINRYIEEAKCLGIDPQNCEVSQITDNLCSAISRNVTTARKDSLNACPRDTILLPVKERIEEYLKEGITKAKIRRLLARDGIVVSESSLARFVRSHLGHLERKVTVRLPETEPGQYAQADFGKLGKLYDETTKRIRIAWAFIVTLAYSRLMFVYITFRLDTRAVISGLEAAWDYFGGIAEILIVDNLTPVVDKADRYCPRIGKTFLEYSQHRGFVVDPTNPGHAKGKPIVENNVSYVRSNFFKGESFISLDDCQERAIDWCTNVAGVRIHGTTRLRPIDVFSESEKEKLNPYDGTRYDIPYYASPMVHPDHHISFKKSLYSLPTKYIGKHVDVRGDSALVKIYFKDELIKIHPRMPEGKRSTDFSDYPAEISPYTLRNANYQIGQGTRRHPAIGEYIKFLLSGTYPWHRIRSAQSVLRISDKYGVDRTADACTKAMAYSVYDVRRIERMLKNGVEKDLPKSEGGLTLFEESSRFARDGAYFKNYS
jgi:transposase